MLRISVRVRGLGRRAISAAPSKISEGRYSEFLRGAYGFWRPERSPGDCERLQRLPLPASILGASNVTREEDVMAALDKPRALYAIQQLVDPSNKSTDALQDLLMRMRTSGKVKFDIKTGHWKRP